MAEPPFGATTWQQEDADWERWQSAGLEALLKGDDKSGSDAIARALQIARQHFEPGDPRLASSLASHALMLSQRDDPLAGNLFAEAIDHWNSIKRWLDRQPLPRLARSSMFHVRLETKHPGAYPNDTYRHCLSLAVAGMEATKTLADDKGITDEEVVRTWHPESHKDFDALRKVTTAVRLMAHR